MSTTTHTPGPWRIEGEFDADTGVSVVSDLGGGTGLICELGPWCGEWDENEIADALLIAAAPDLLASLKETKDAAAVLMLLIADFARIYEIDLELMIDQRLFDGFGVRAQAAIAKAEGTSPGRANQSSEPTQPTEAKL